jgi:hypothetical protein
MITKSMAAGNHQPGRKQAEDRYLRRTNGRQLGQAAGRASPRSAGRGARLDDQSRYGHRYGVDQHGLLAGWDRVRRFTTG